MPENNSKPSLLSTLYRYLLTITVCVLPGLAAWDYGGVLPWTKWCLSAASIAILILILPLCFRRLPNSTLAYSLCLVGLMALGLGALQLVPLPAGLVEWASPATHSAYTQWLPGDSAASIPMTIDTALTRSYLVLPVLFVTFSLAGMILLRDERTVVLFLMIGTISGVAIGYLGMADKISEHSDFLVPSSAPLPFGPFVNRNNAAGFLNLSLACALGWLVHRHRTRLSERRYDSRYQIIDGSLIEKMVGRVRRFVRLSDNLSFAIACLIVIIVSSIFVCGSRGGMLALFVGAFVSVLRSVGHKRQFTGLVATSLGFVLVGFLLGLVGMVSSVRDRMGQLFGDAAFDDSRLGHWYDSATAALQYLPMGSGMGTYRYAYLPFQSMGGMPWFVNADGMPFEWLLEGGLPMLGIVCIGIVVCFMLLSNIAFYKNDAITAAVAASSWFAVPSLFISQSFDFGILMPANTMLAALVLGALAASAKSIRNETPRQERSSKNALRRKRGSKDRAKPKPSRRLWRHGLVATIWIPCMLGSAFSVHWQNEFARVDHVTRRTAHWTPELVGATTECKAILDNAEALLEQYPSNPDLLLATSRLNVINSRSVVQDAVERPVTEQLFDSNWLYSSLEVRRYQYFLNRRDSESQEWNESLLPNQNPESFQRAHQLAQDALKLSPYNDQVRLQLIRLDFVDDQTDSTPKYVEQLHRLRKRSPYWLHQLGTLTSIYPGAETAIPIWRDELLLAPERLPRVWQRVREMQSDVEISSIVPNDINAMLYVAELMKPDDEEREPLLERIAEMLGADSSDQEIVLTKMDDPESEDPMKDGVRIAHNDFDRSDFHVASSRLARLRGDLVTTEIELSKAIAINPDSDLLYRYCVVLADNKKFEEARDHLDLLQLRDPQSKLFLLGKLIINWPGGVLSLGKRSTRYFELAKVDQPA